MGSTENMDELYGVSWSNPALSHFLCSSNVLDYFCDLSNPFYDRQCNNEVIRMQRLSPEQLSCMTGVEFHLDHAQTLAPCARYHPSDGSYSWDDPDTLLGVNSETDLNVLKGSSNQKAEGKLNQFKPPNLFQVQRTDALLADWLMQFPLPPTQTASTAQTPAVSGATPSIPPAVHTVGTSNISSSASAMHSGFREEPPSHVSNSPAKAPIKSQAVPGVSVEKRPRI